MTDQEQKSKEGVWISIGGVFVLRSCGHAVCRSAPSEGLKSKGLKVVLND